MRFLLCIFIPLFVFGRSIFSDIPPVSVEVIDLNTESCDKDCLFDLSKDKKIFSFIARFSPDIEDEKLKQIMSDYSKKIGLYYYSRKDLLDSRLNVALLLPKKVIDRHSISTIDTILAYLVMRNIDFRFKVFDSIDGSTQSFQSALDSIQNEQFDFIISIVMNSENLSLLDSIGMPVYVPNRTKNGDFKHILFGGINYENQIKELMDEKKGRNIISYDEDSALGAYLGNLVKKNSDEGAFYSDVITSKIASNLESNLNKVKAKIPTSSIFLNTSIVKSGMILSQINFLKDKPLKILSTQVNFNPAFINLLRGINTENIMVASSIGDAPKELLEYGYLLSSDMQYDWVNYATALGIDLFLSEQKDGLERLFIEDVRDGAVAYRTRLYNIINLKFIED